MQKKKWQERRIALERIGELFGQALKEDEQILKNRYVDLARKIAMKHRLRMPRQYKRRFCSHCYSYLTQGLNSRVRLTGRTVSILCMSCGRFTRITYPARQKPPASSANPSRSAGIQR